MVRHKREGKNYVIKKVKTRDMNPKDLENTENEVYFTVLMLTRFDCYKRSGIQISWHTRIHLLTENST